MKYWLTKQTTNSLINYLNSEAHTFSKHLDGTS